MQVPVQTRARALLGNDGQHGLENATDEEENAIVTQRLEYGHFVAECLRLGGRWVLHVQEFNCHHAVVEVARLMNDSERARAHFLIDFFYLLERNLPRVERIATIRL